MVLMSTYNGEKYLESQLNSILKQEGEFELKILIRDDGSNDNTRIILKNYEKNHHQIKVIYGFNIGWMKSFNELIFQSDEAHYYSFSDQDDIWMPNKLAKGIEKIKSIKSQKALLYGSGFFEVNENLQILKKNVMSFESDFTGLSVMLCSFTLGCTMIFNDSARKIYISKPKKMFYVGHDWLLATICAYFGDLIFDENAYIYHRRHNNNVSGTLSLNKILVNKISALYNAKIGSTAYQELYDGYNELLNKEDLRIINNFVNYRKSFLAKYELLINPRIKKSTFKGSILLKLAIILNKHV